MCWWTPNWALDAAPWIRENRCRYPTLAKRAIAQRIQEENTSEEQRVLYVAMTRPKDMLIMTYASRYLTKRLEAIARQVTLGSNTALSQEADCLGHWILMAAMVRTEAGELFAQAGQPEETVVRGAPGGSGSISGVRYRSLRRRCFRLRQGSRSRCRTCRRCCPSSIPHQSAVQAPSKVTATQLKGRELDREAAGQAMQPLLASTRRWRQPAFLTQRPLEGREIGTATHLAMQFLRYEACGSQAGVEAELNRLLAEGFLTARQARAVNRQWIGDFFRTELGQRLQRGQDVLREFKFSIFGRWQDPARGPDR